MWLISWKRRATEWQVGYTLLLLKLPLNDVWRNDDDNVDLIDRVSSEAIIHSRIGQNLIYHSL